MYGNNSPEIRQQEVNEANMQPTHFSTYRREDSQHKVGTSDEASASGNGRDKTLVPEPEATVSVSCTDQKESSNADAKFHDSSNMKVLDENETNCEKEECVGTSSSDQKAVSSRDHADDSAGIKHLSKDEQFVARSESDDGVAPSSCGKKETSNVADNVNDSTEFKNGNLGLYKSKNIITENNTRSDISSSCNLVSGESEDFKDEACNSNREITSEMETSDNVELNQDAQRNEQSGHDISSEDAPSSLVSFQCLDDTAGTDNVDNASIKQPKHGVSDVSSMAGSDWNRSADGRQSETKLSESSSAVSSSANPNVAEPQRQVLDHAPDVNHGNGMLDTLDDLQAVMSKNSNSVNREKMKGINRRKITVDKVVAVSANENINHSLEGPDPVISTESTSGQKDERDHSSQQASGNLEKGVNTHNSSEENMSANDTETDHQSTSSLYTIDVGRLLTFATHQVLTSTLGNTQGWTPP